MNRSPTKVLEGVGNALFPVFSIAITVALALSIDGYFSERHRAGEQLSMARLSASAASAIERSLHERVLITEAVHSAFEANPEISQQQFGELADRLTQAEEDIINVAAARGYVIEYVHPLEQNQAALGLDLRATESFLSGVERSIETGRTIIDGPRELVQGGRGFITRAAVSTRSTDDGPPEFWGVVSVVINNELFFQSFDLAPDIFGADVLVREADGGILFGNPEVATLSPIETPVRVSGMDWVVSVVPIGGWSTSPPFRPVIWMVAALVALLSLWILGIYQSNVARTRRAERQLHEAIGALDDGFALYDSSDRLVMCNDRYKELYAASAASMVPGASFEEIIRFGLDRGQYLDAIGREEEWLAERLSAHRTQGVTLEQRMPDGRWLRVVERATPSGGMAGFRVDITELKAALERSEYASAAKSNFLNTVSHELRTPLAVMLGYNAFISGADKLPSFLSLKAALAEGNSDAASRLFSAFLSDLRKFSGQIDASGQQLMTLISSILDFAAIEQQTMTLEREVVALAPLVEGVADQLRPFAVEKGLSMGLRSSPVTVFGDPDRLRQVLSNLIGNAIKFTERGGIEITAGTS